MFQPIELRRAFAGRSFRSLKSREMRKLHVSAMQDRKREFAGHSGHSWPQRLVPQAFEE
jgi:hypothetical protein